MRNAEAAAIILSKGDPDLEEIRENITDIERDDRRAGDVIGRLRSLLKRGQLHLQPVALDALIAEAISLARAEAAQRGVKLSSSVEPGLLRVRGDCIHLQQVFLNLILNAMDALDELPREQRAVQISARTTRPPATGIPSGSLAVNFVEVRVCDSGPGISPDAMDRLFDHFFTTKPNGMGMGLPVSKTIIEAHGGVIRAENRAEGGACFCVTLPSANAAGRGGAIWEGE